MKPTQVSIFKLNGNKKAIREYAEAICGNSFTNAYVIAFNKDNDICWCFQGSNEESEVREDMTWEDVVRVEIYDHTLPCTNEEITKFEQVYVNTKKALATFFEERESVGESYEIITNQTKFKLA